jgi:hypothetical protein
MLPDSRFIYFPQLVAQVIISVSSPFLVLDPPHHLLQELLVFLLLKLQLYQPLLSLLLLSMPSSLRQRCFQLSLSKHRRLSQP